MQRFEHSPHSVQSCDASRVTKHSSSDKFPSIKQYCSLVEHCIIIDVCIYIPHRCGVAGLLAGLGHLYLFLFQCLIILEISSLTCSPVFTMVPHTRSSWTTLLLIPSSSSTIDHVYCQYSGMETEFSWSLCICCTSCQSSTPVSTICSLLCVCVCVCVCACVCTMSLLFALFDSSFSVWK